VICKASKIICQPSKIICQPSKATSNPGPRHHGGFLSRPIDESGNVTLLIPVETCLRNRCYRRRGASAALASNRCLGTIVAAGRSVDL
jgi:hypothetical protein